MPPEVEQAIDKRSSMAAVGNLNDYVKFQMAQGMEKGGSGGAGGIAAEMAVGMAMAQQMMNQSGGLMAQATPGHRARRRHRERRRARSDEPAQVAQMLGVAESDVIASLESGDLKGKKIGTQWRVPQGGGRHVSEDVSEAARDPAQPAHRRRAARSHRAAKIRVPGLRRRGGLESGQARSSSARSAAPSRRHSSTAGGTIVEHDLVAALRAMPRRRARLAGAETRQVRCQSCNAISVLDPSRQAQTCEFCGSAQLVPYDRDEAAFRPESVLPFRLSEAQARDGIRAWYGRLWLAPGALKRRALTDTVSGVYLPYWTFDAQVDADWTAEAGHYYYETETYVVNGETRTRQVQRIRWEPAAGRVRTFLRRRSRLRVGRRAAGADARHRAVSDAASSKPYDAGYVAGWVVERYQIDLVDAAQRARADMDAEAAGAVRARRSPATPTATWSCTPDYSGQTFKHILAPVWLLSYTFGARRSSA